MNVRRIAGLVAVGLAVYLLTLVLAAPAARVIEWVEPEGATIEGASGRIWAGHAQRVRIDGMELPLTDVSWDVQAWRLVTGEFGSVIEAGAAELEGRGYVGVDGGGTIRVADLTVRGPVAGLLEQLPYPVAASGSLLARVESGSVAAGVPRGLRGRAVWSDARLQAPLAIGLGEVVAEFEPDGAGQIIDLRAKGGEIAVDGRIILQADGRYDIEMALTPSESAGSRVRDTLTLVARPDEQGRYVVRQSGRLR